MSQYVNFLVRQREVDQWDFGAYTDNFVPLFDYCRSSKVYAAFQGIAPWEKVRKVSAADLTRVEEALRDNIEYDRARIAQVKERIKLIGSFPDPIEDRLDLILEEQGAIDDYEISIREAERALALMDLLEDIVENYDNLYVGTEAPCAPKPEEILES